MSQYNNNQNEEKRSLPFFGIGKVLPFMKPYKKVLVIMVSCGLLTTCFDLLIPQFQRYALNHFISCNTLDTLWLFIPVYVFSLVLMGVFWVSVRAMAARCFWPPERVTPRSPTKVS